MHIIIFTLVDPIMEFLILLSISVWVVMQRVVLERKACCIHRPSKADVIAWKQWSVKRIEEQGCLHLQLMPLIGIISSLCKFPIVQMLTGSVSFIYEVLGVSMKPFAYFSCETL